MSEWRTKVRRPCWRPQKQHYDNGRRHTRQLDHRYKQENSPMSPGESLGGFPQRWCVWQTGRACRSWPSSCLMTRPKDAHFPPEETYFETSVMSTLFSLSAIMCLITNSSFSCCVCPFNFCPKTISGLWKIPQQMIWLLFLFTFYFYLFFWKHHVN